MLGGACDTEVDEVSEVVLGDQDVGRFDVAVDQADPVRRVQRQSDLLDDAHRSRRLQRTVLEKSVHIATLDQPHRHVEASVDFAELMYRDHMGLVETGCSLRLAAKPLSKHLVAGVGFGQNLQCHDTVHIRVIGPPHLAHAATAHQLDQAIAAERRALHVHLPDKVRFSTRYAVPNPTVGNEEHPAPAT